MAAINGILMGVYAVVIYGHGGHLGYVASIMSSYFHFLVPERFHKQVAQRATIAHLTASHQNNLNVLE